MKAAQKTKKHRPAKDEWSDTKDYEFHPLAGRFPLMEGAEFEDLANDIATNGQNETVKLFEGKILDGRNRYQACKARKKPCRYENWSGEGDAAADYVVSMNLHRRHLTPDTRKALVIELRQKGKSIRQIAESLHTSFGSVHRDIEAATDPDGSAGAQELPITITGKDGKVRPARKSKKEPATKKPSHGKSKPAAAGEPVKGERPKIAELAAIIHRGLAAADEAKELSLRAGAVFFKIKGCRIKVTCRIV